MKKIHDIIIIGGGISGMTAAIYGRRSGKSVLIIEKGFFGGQIISTSEIENYPGAPSVQGYSFASDLYAQIDALSPEKASDETISIEREKNMWLVICAKASYIGKTLIIASGTKNRALGLPNEDKYLGRGISYCATCDGAFRKNQRVAVVGGGNTALEDALYLSLLCDKVYLIHRRHVFSGEAALQKRVFASDNIETIFGANIINLHGKNSLEKIEIRTDNAQTVNTVIDKSESAPEIVPGAPQSESSAEVLNVTGLFVAIGQIPQNEPFRNIVNIDEHGYIIAGEDCHTNAEGIFAAGDCRTKELRQLVTAASDGAVAATEAIRLLNSKL